MIYRYDIKKSKRHKDYYTVSRYSLYTKTSLRGMSDDLWNDGFTSEALWYDGHYKKTPVWILETSEGGGWVHLPPKARRKYTREQKRKVERGQIVSLYACIWRMS